MTVLSATLAHVERYGSLDDLLQAAALDLCHARTARNGRVSNRGNAAVHQKAGGE